MFTNAKVLKMERIQISSTTPLSAVKPLIKQTQQLIIKEVKRDNKILDVLDIDTIHRISIMYNVKKENIIYKPQDNNSDDKQPNPVAKM